MNILRQSKTQAQHVPSIDILVAPLGARRACRAPRRACKGPRDALLALRGRRKTGSVGKGARGARARAVGAACGDLVASCGAQRAVCSGEERLVRARRAEGAVTLGVCVFFFLSWRAEHCFNAAPQNGDGTGSARPSRGARGVLVLCASAVEAGGGEVEAPGGGEGGRDRYVEAPAERLAARGCAARELVASDDLRPDLSCGHVGD